MDANFWMSARLKPHFNIFFFDLNAKTFGLSQINRERLTGIAEVYRESAFRPSSLRY